MSTLNNIYIDTITDTSNYNVCDFYFKTKNFDKNKNKIIRMNKKQYDKKLQKRESYMYQKHA